MGLRDTRAARSLVDTKKPPQGRLWHHGLGTAARCPLRDESELHRRRRARPEWHLAAARGVVGARWLCDRDRRMPIMTLDLQKAEHNAIHALRREFSDWRPWLTRALVICFAAMAGLTIVAFTWLTDLAFAGFQRIAAIGWWLQLLWMPAATAAIVWLTRRYAPGAAGSGIPQVMAALDTGVASADVPRFVSLRLAFSKLVLTAAGLLAGLSLGREGPSVQIAAGVMHSVRRWLPERTAITAVSYTHLTLPTKA